MAKLITHTKDCAHRINIMGKLMCKHPDSTIRYCDYTGHFPSYCPLPDGTNLLPKDKALKEMVEYELRRHKVPRTVKSGSLRRNCKDCIWFDAQDPNRSYKSHYCANSNKNNHHCQGVNCGYFETKTK